MYGLCLGRVDPASKKTNKDGSAECRTKRPQHRSLNTRGRGSCGVARGKRERRRESEGEREGEGRGSMHLKSEQNAGQASPEPDGERAAWAVIGRAPGDNRWMWMARWPQGGVPRRQQRFRGPVSACEPVNACDSGPHRKPAMAHESGLGSSETSCNICDMEEAWRQLPHYLIAGKRARAGQLEVHCGLPGGPC